MVLTTSMLVLQHSMTLTVTSPKRLLLWSVNTGAVGSYDVTYNVKDAGGNSATEVVRNVTVEDTTIPVITLNGENKMNAEAGGPLLIQELLLQIM